MIEVHGEHSSQAVAIVEINFNSKGLYSHFPFQIKLFSVVLPSSATRGQHSSQRTMSSIVSNLE